ncbi:MAG: N-acetylglucosaminyl-diphospho-decaprenol L-rhamnosyltransferase [Acidimicrobiaceae bacterium]|nr:N-acetylglucosaminyl-diphospho-decaprenol L-rhamnosyltransferase [Acidimicrobiaceae bacterium]
MTVSAVIVNYKARDLLVRCVRSLRAEGVDDVVVADNDSRDGSREALAAADPAARWLDTGANLGFAGGANRGAAVADEGSDVLLICNPDLEVEPGAVKAMVAVLEADAGVAIVGPRVENPDGTVYPSPRIFPGLMDAVGHAFVGFFKPDNAFTRRYRMLDLDRGVAAPDVDWVSGSCLVVRRSVWEDLGGFDESYFMYAEDVDLCWRAKANGWRVAFEPAASVVHVQGASTDQRPYRMIVRHHRSILKFWSRTVKGPMRALVPVGAVVLAVRAALACSQRALRAARAR